MRSFVVVCLFDQWRMGIVEPFPLGTAQKKFLIVMVDYFSKWVETEQLVCITEQAIMKFL